jgi:hypothetical protein
MLVVAGSLVFVVMDRGQPDGSQAPKAPFRGRMDQDARRTPIALAGQPHRFQPAAGANAPARLAGGQSRHAVQAPKTLRQDLKVEVNAADPRRDELEQRAKLVESFALRRLGILTEELELTDEQQARIFPIFVRGSQSYDPGMRIVSGSQARPAPQEGDVASSAPLEKLQEHNLVQKELNPAQSDELIDRSIGDLLIWEEIIGGLTRKLDEAVPGEVGDLPPERGMTAVQGLDGPVEEVPATGGDPAAPPESHGGRNLFEQLESDP